MRDDIYSHLGKQYEGAARCKKIEAMLAQMQNDKRMLAAALEQYKRELAKESLDVYKLETEGLSSLLHSAFGSLNSQLQKERFEALKAKLKCRQAEKELEEINKCIESLEAERKKLEGCGAEYRRLYKQKLHRMLREHGPMAERIMELVEDINNEKALLKEIKEAIAAGENATRCLRSTFNDLEKAESRGIFDMAYSKKTGRSGRGRSLMGTMVEFEKHDYFSNAVTGAEIAQSAINSFKSELADINIKISNPDLGLSTSKGLRFADTCLDWLAVDWYAQKRIEGSLNSVKMSKADVEQKVTMLKTLEFETQRRLNDLKSKLDFMILGLKRDMESMSENIKEMLE